MNYRYLGRSGLAVSRICLGTATFGQRGWGCDEDASVQILNAFKNQGGNFIDTADKYADTISEQIIGRWLTTQKRDEWVVATKCFFKTSEDINSRGLSRKHIVSACEASLKRLQTDYIDLYQVHESDPQTPMEETMGALDDLVRQGKVRYIGCSNYPGWKVMKTAFIAQQQGLSRFISGQYLYNLLKRDIEAEVVPACEDSGVGVLCWSPLSGGMLTGKYQDPDSPPEDSRLFDRPELSKDRYRQWYENSGAIVKRVKEIAERSGVTSSTVALAWLLQKPNVASVVVGARRLEQILENCIAGNWLMSDEDIASLDEVSMVGHGYPTDQIRNVVQDWFDRIQ